MGIGSTLRLGAACGLSDLISSKSVCHLGHGKAMLSLVKSLVQHPARGFCLSALQELADFLSVNAHLIQVGYMTKILNLAFVFPGFILFYALPVVQGLVKMQAKGAEHPAPGYPGGLAGMKPHGFIPKAAVQGDTEGPSAPCPWQHPRLDTQEKEYSNRPRK